jgi:hypothetical protein
MAGAAFVERKGVVMAGIENVRIRFIAGFAGRSSGPLPQAGSCTVRSSIFLSRRRRTGIWPMKTKQAKVYAKVPKLRRRLS